MIGFFRRIRRKLATENQFFKYSRYAVGETVLVVIGILIALQINNWNQQKIAFNEEQVLLKILKNDFENRLHELTILNEGRIDAAKACEKLLSFVDHPQENYPSNEIDSLLAIVTLTYWFNEKFCTLDMLFNSGRINTLSNDNLKYLLVNWPTLVEEMLEEQRLIVENYSKIETVLGRHISLRDIFQNFSWLKVEMPDIAKSEMNKDYTGLMNDKRFQTSFLEKDFCCISI